MPDVALALQDPRLADELHAFLWTERFINRGATDDGWSCRDHVVVVGSLLAGLDHEVTIRHGRCMFVQGPGADGAAPVGIGQEGTSKIGHAWLAADGIGDVDLSPRLERRQPPWPGVAGRGVFGSSWRAERPARFLMTTTIREYERAIAYATGATDQLHAVYLTERDEPFTAEITRAGLSWARSRVSQRLLERGFADDLYMRLAAHVVGVGSGTRRSLSGISRNKAWSIVAESDRD